MKHLESISQIIPYQNPITYPEISILHQLTVLSGSEINVTFKVDEKASTATFETDYRISNLTFGPSTRSGSFILSDHSNTHRLYLNAKRDTEVELNETIVVIFTSPNAVFANDLNSYAHTFTINDDDDATIIPNNVAVASSASTFSIDLNLCFAFGTKYINRCR